MDIAKVMAAGFILVALSVKLAEWMGASPSLPSALQGILGSKYFVVTTLTVLIVTLFPKFFEEARGSQEIGTFLIYIFLVVIGTPASIKAILLQSPIILLFRSEEHTSELQSLSHLVCRLLLEKKKGFTSK